VKYNCKSTHSDRPTLRPWNSRCGKINKTRWIGARHILHNYQNLTYGWKGKTF